MRPRLLAVDLDGTLLDRSGLPHARDVAALKLAQQQGITVTICTGRLYSGTRDAAGLVGIHGPVACVDGSMVVDTRGHRRLVHHPIAREHASILRAHFVDSPTATFVFARDAIVHDGYGDPFVDYVRTWSNEVERTQCVTDHHAWEHDDGVTAVVAVGIGDSVEKTKDAILQSLPGIASVATFPLKLLPGCRGMVVRADRATKGTALGWLAQHHGVAMQDTIAVGDWHNDTPMFEVAGRSFAMGQAPDEVKAKATDRLTETAETGGGVARAIAVALGIEAATSSGGT
jgi:hydroxymethylpyrimidine pyrophosphatase-like HAD family hydrolase